MPDVRGCDIPDDLLYWPEKHVWARLDPGGFVTVGVTDVAQSLAHNIISAMPKAAGRPTKKGRSLGTIESSKWVGPVTSPLSGEILEANPLLAQDPGIVNRDPYGEGWFVKIQPSDWESEAEAGELVTGPDGVAAYEAFLESEGISCGEA
ncbi:MAG: glycine cleavage system protein H [Acidimicrobiia bacterium]|nr:glycine cleavage system protein H [Acidimicrobiia bacterium]